MTFLEKMYGAIGILLGSVTTGTTATVPISAFTASALDETASVELCAVGCSDGTVVEVSEITLLPNSDGSFKFSSPRKSPHPETPTAISKAAAEAAKE